ncbi:MAG: DUF4398 domain-containing protein [Pseudomonadota bacterium]|nr:DUF4398 domain-containing protein [Xanthomonadaceae bacterium]MDE3211182.1 DUF4398 domain-containing protein [Pseudomonadota bacterium]
MYIFLPLAGSPRRFRATAPALLLALLLGLAGCASVPPPNDSMSLAQTRLQSARDADAADYDPVDLGFAQDKFQAAQAAMAERKYADAANLAGESIADADLARAKARLAVARSQIQAKLDENNRLRSIGERAAAAERREGLAAPSPAASAPPPPTQDMPAPSSSALSAPPADGFQTVPSSATSTTQGGQP